MATRRSISAWMAALMIVGQLAVIWIKALRENGATDAFWGYAPNLAAAATLPGLFVALHLLRGAEATEAYPWSRFWRQPRLHAMALLISSGGLLAWEFVQVYRPNRTFDTQDVVATLAGAGLWGGMVVAGYLLTADRRRHPMTSEIASSPVSENPTP